jgi:hypothetical protein
VRRAGGLDQIDPGTSHRDVKLLRTSGERGQLNHPIGYTPQGLAASVPHQQDDCEPDMVSVGEFGQRARFKPFNQLVVSQHAQACPLGSPIL